MNRDSKDPKQHPVPVTLDALENILQSCKQIALAGALNEIEDVELAAITEATIALYDRFADRELVDAFCANGLEEDPEILVRQERVRNRLLQDLQKGDQELQNHLLSEIPKFGKTH